MVVWTDDNCNTDIDDSTLKKAGYQWEKLTQMHYCTALCLQIRLPCCHSSSLWYRGSIFYEYESKSYILSGLSCKCQNFFIQCIIHFPPKKTPELFYITNETENLRIPYDDRNFCIQAMVQRFISGESRPMRNWLIRTALLPTARNFGDYKVLHHVKSYVSIAKNAYTR